MKARKDRAKLFRNGRSQAVRLPKEYRFNGDEVLIERRGKVVVLSPCPQPRKRRSPHLSRSAARLLHYIDHGPFAPDFPDPPADPPPEPAPEF